jgi:hypothetical protein
MPRPPCAAARGTPNRDRRRGLAAGSFTPNKRPCRAAAGISAMGQEPPHALQKKSSEPLPQVFQLSMYASSKSEPCALTAQGGIGRHASRKRAPPRSAGVIHDLRADGALIDAAASVRPYVAERALKHIIPGVEGVYHRHHHSDVKADTVSKLAPLVERIIEPPRNRCASSDAPSLAGPPRSAIEIPPSFLPALH